MNIEHKYCPCGFPVRISYFWNGMKYVSIFRTETDYIIITHCPDCGEQLRKEILIELGNLE